MKDAQSYFNIDGKWVPFHKLPCARCVNRYSMHCPCCKWNADGHYDTYSGKLMTAEEAEKLNKEYKHV